jgi:hypothetical protein
MLTLGNLGFSKTECILNSMIQGNKATLRCNTGIITELIDFGVTT